VAPFHVVRQSYPTQLKNAPEAGVDVFDWAGELANQLLGRIKNRIAARGVDLITSTPKVMLAQHFQMASSIRGAICELRFRAGKEPIGIWIDVIASSNDQLFVGPPKAVCAAEGELMLF
jgi:chemotaxis protein CheX